MPKKPLISVVVPVYNVEGYIKRCIDSIRNQTIKDIEIILIDDGSTDNTAELVTRWQKENIISIRYIYKKNGGMHSGYNVAYENIFSELSICVDSDDYLLDNAIERILTFWDHNKTDGIAGIVALNVTKDGKVIGNNLPNLKSIKIYDYYNRLKGKGDKKMIYRPEVIRPYTSPEFENERLFPTAYKYFNVDLNYDMLVLNEPLCVVEYMPDGFTKNIIKHYKKKS